MICNDFPAFVVRQVPASPPAASTCAGRSDRRPQRLPGGLVGDGDGPLARLQQRITGRQQPYRLGRAIRVGGDDGRQQVLRGLQPDPVDDHRHRCRPVGAHAAGRDTEEIGNLRHGARRRTARGTSGRTRPGRCARQGGPAPDPAAQGWPAVPGPVRAPANKGVDRKSISGTCSIPQGRHHVANAGTAAVAAVLTADFERGSVTMRRIAALTSRYPSSAATPAFESAVPEPPSRATASCSSAGQSAAATRGRSARRWKCGLPRQVHASANVVRSAGSPTVGGPASHRPSSPPLTRAASACAAVPDRSCRPSPQRASCSIGPCVRSRPLARMR